MLPKRISIKFFAANPEAVDPAAFVPIFQRWIQEHAVEGLLVDVTDYKHVRDGPGILLIGHEGDYAYNLSDERPGLQYVRKTGLPGTLVETLHMLYRLALAAARQIEAEPSLNGLRFRYDQAEIAFLDRLHTPNTPELWKAIQPEVQAALADLYGDASIELTSAREDPCECLAISVQATGDVTAAGLLDRLGKPVPESL